MRQLVAPARPGWAVAAAAALLLTGNPEASAAPLSLDDCVGLALRNNLSVEQARGTLRSAEADVIGARAAFLPSLRVSGTYTKPESLDFFFNEEDGMILGFPESWSYNGNADLLLFDGLGNVSTYKGASRSRRAADFGLLDAKQGVVYETERRYFEVLKSKELLDVQQEALKLSEEQLKKTSAMKELGAATQADVYKSEVDHANNRLEVLRASRNLEVAKASLATYLGIDPREDLVLLEEDLELSTDVTLENALSHAAESNPGLLSSMQSEKAREAGVTAAKADRWPSLSLFYNVSYRFGEPATFEDQWITSRYGVSLDYALFDGFQRKSRIQRAQSDLLTARRAAESTERDVLFAVRQAWLDLEIAREAINVSQEAVRSSEEDLRLAQERYKIGEGTILDVIDAQVNLTRSRSNLVTATYDRRLAVSALHDAIGDIPVPEPSE